MLGIFGLFLQAAAGHILYLALHLESGSFPRPLPPDRERAAFADLQKGGAAAAQAATICGSSRISAKNTMPGTVHRTT